MPGVLYDLQGFALYRRRIATAFRGGDVPRAAITGLSARSCARMRRYLRRCESNYSVMLTLTYPFSFPGDGRIAKRHLDSFVKVLFRADTRERKAGLPAREPLSVFWFMEFQARGAPHFHLYLNRRFDKELCARAWYDVVGTEDPRHLAAGTRIELIRSGRWGTVAYAAKYASKLAQKEIPADFTNSGRFWGVYGSRRVKAATIYFDLSEGENPQFEAFRQDLTVLMANYEGAIRFKGCPGTTTRIMYCKTQSVVDALLILMHRHGMRALLSENGRDWFESPMLQVESDDLSATAGM